MGEIYRRGASRIDQCAHAIYDFTQNRKSGDENTWHRTSVLCWACGNPLETMYFEERLYAVRCSHCTIETVQDDNVPMMLIKAGNPDKAAEIYLRRDKLAYESRNNTNAAVISDVLRYASDLYESGITNVIACVGNKGMTCVPERNGERGCDECIAEWLEREYKEW